MRAWLVLLLLALPAASAQLGGGRILDSAPRTLGFAWADAVEGRVLDANGEQDLVLLVAHGPDGARAHRVTPGDLAARTPPARGADGFAVWSPIAGSGLLSVRFAPGPGAWAVQVEAVDAGGLAGRSAVLAPPLAPGLPFRLPAADVPPGPPL
ncbi:MAG: hypothetical protein LC624_10205 [Halobacteriales archaeon]|nr:hypothetical protein [Halobacteriales archaeon]